MEKPHGFPIASKAEESRASSPGPVLKWLEDLEIHQPAEDYHQSAFEGASRLSPDTPHRITKAPLRNGHEISPTTTRFSSIFDQTTGYQTSCPSSPCYKRGYAASAISAPITTDEEWKTSPKNAGDQVSDEVSPSSAPDEYAAFSLNSYDPPTELATTEAASAHESVISSEVVVRDLNEPQMVWVVSCLQCILKGLPCSRTLPACSRCVRSGCGDTCLLQRRRFSEEMVRIDGETQITPLLLRTYGDDDTVWENKTKLFQELYESWIMAKERDNWVLPINDGKKGISKAQSRYLRFRVPKRGHPGEGLGRRSYRLLRLG